MIDQEALRRHHLSQYEWMAPGITGIIKPMDPATADAAAGERQPNPMPTGPGGGEGRPAGSPGGNRGGGQKGFSPQNPVPFEEFKKNFPGVKK